MAAGGPRVPVLLIGATAAGLLVLVSDPFGSNVLRLGLLLAGPLVLATAADRIRVVGPVTALLVLWQVQPTWDDLREPRVTPFPTGVDVDGGLRRYEGWVEAKRSGAIGYTVRVVPHHALLANSAEMGLATLPAGMHAPTSV